jgi:hypothetical protein
MNGPIDAAAVKEGAAQRVRSCSCKLLLAVQSRVLAISASAASVRR